MRVCLSIGVSYSVSVILPLKSVSIISFDVVTEPEIMLFANGCTPTIVSFDVIAVSLILSVTIL